ncbi:MAG TPA: ATP-dependent zinc protease [Luteolibacter sp.]|nr:ATP-dependent zinc protease [Luteolibacter sp.]
MLREVKPLMLGLWFSGCMAALHGVSEAQTPAAPTPPPTPPVQPPAAAAPSPKPPAPAPAAPSDNEELSAEQKEIAEAAVAKPVSGEKIQIYGWREKVLIQGLPSEVSAKLDTGARTSCIHAESRELFERDGKKWVRFIVTDPTVANSFKVRLEAPLVRVAHIKEPGGASVPREVVMLGFQIGERKLRGEFTLNDRSNMLAPVLIGRTLIQELGLVDSRRAYIADQKVFSP